MKPLFLVRCNAYHRIKSHDPQLEKFTVNSFDFRFCNITCQVGNFRVSCEFPELTAEKNPLIPLKSWNKRWIKKALKKKFDSHRSGCGLLGMRIPFATHTLAL